VPALDQTLRRRKQEATPGSYTQRLFSDAALLASKLHEEVGELVAATTAADVAAEAADVLYFTLVKCAAHGVALADVERQLDLRARRLTRRPGNAKPAPAAATLAAAPAAATPVTAHAAATVAAVAPVPVPVPAAIKMQHFDVGTLAPGQWEQLLQRPVSASGDILARVQPILDAVLARGDAALLELTERYDRVKLASPVVDLRAPGRVRPVLAPAVQAAIDAAMSNVRRFHAAQMPTTDLRIETVPGVECSRFVRPIERVGLYVPGGSAVRRPAPARMRRRLSSTAHVPVMPIVPWCVCLCVWGGGARYCPPPRTCWGSRPRSPGASKSLWRRRRGRTDASAPRSSISLSR
jgi:phosphoribosyl-ATP pyrophosphohydrolase / phosphoribosyl-AMP cyclohydrolase / histidinol dehydrogenase